MKENSFKLTKESSRRYLAQIITDADYADDIALLTNAPDQAETLLCSLERAAAGISLHVNAHKTEYMCFNQTGDISTLNDSSIAVFLMNYTIVFRHTNELRDFDLTTHNNESFYLQL